MKLEKAIEILERPCGQSSGLTLKEILEAEKLGIEALKFIEGLRAGFPRDMWKRLSGETEE